MATELNIYHEWALGRIKNGENPTDLAAFTVHLKAIGKDFTKPRQYGWQLRNAADVIAHLDKAKDLLLGKA